MKMLSRALAGLAMLCAVLVAGVMTAPMPLLAQAVGFFQQTGTGGVVRSFISKLRETSSVLDFGAKCDASIDDTAAFQAAINWLPQGGPNGQYGGRIRVPYTGATYPSGGGCILASALNLNGKTNITIEGDANPSINGSTSLIYYTGGAAARFIDARDSHGVTLKDLTIIHTSALFTGILVDAGGNTPAVNPTSFGSLSDHFRLLNTRLVGVGTATLLNVNQAQLFEVSGNVFTSGKPSIRGALVKQGSSTTGTFERNSHSGNVGPAIDGCGDTWTFIAENFEPDSTGALNAFGNSTLTPCRSLHLTNTWPGDFTGGTTGIFLSYLGDGLTISGGRITGTATSTAVKFLGPTTAVHISGASIEAFATGIDFNGMAVDGVKVSPNKFIGVTTKFANAGSVTGFDSGAEGNSPSTSRATTGQLLIGQSAADAAWKTLTGNVTVNTTGVTAIGTAQVTLAMMATQAANTVLANATGGAASPTAFGMPSCSTSASALNWTTNTGFGCNAAIAASTATTATNATNIAITDDTSTNATVYPAWVTTTTGNLPLKVTSTKFTMNPLNGTFGFGTTPSAASVINISNSPTALSGTFQEALAFNPICSSSATSACIGIYVNTQTAAAAFTAGTMYGQYIDVGTKGAGSTITTQYQLYLTTPTLGGTNYALYSQGGDNHFGGNIKLTPSDILLFSVTAPTATTFCTSPSIPNNNGTAAFTINVGTACATSVGTITMPTATTGWVCDFHNITNFAANKPDQSGGTTTTVTLTNFSRTTGAATNWTSSDVIRAQCAAY